MEQGKLDIEIWERNSFDVEAVRVTSQNMGDVALWTEGELCRQQTHNGRWYVLVDTVEYNRLRQTKVFVGDWVIRVQGQFKHYRNDSLRLAYHKKDVDREEQIRKVLMDTMTETSAHAVVGDAKSLVKLLNDSTAKIMDIVEGRTNE